MAEGTNRREFLTTTAAAAGGVLGCSPIGGARPNILLILTDQQHIDTIGARGQSHVRTPALDHLASRSTSFENSYCADPVCSPSRSAIFTGRMPSEADVPRNGRPIRPSIPNLGQWFSENSRYETVYAGKWHLPRSYQDSIEGFTVLPGGLGGQGNLGDTAVSWACADYLRNRSAGSPFLMVASFMQPHDICEWLRLNMYDPGELRYPNLAAELPPLPDNFDYESIEPRAIQERRLRNEPAKGNWTEQHWRYYLWSYYRHIEMVDGEIGRILDALEDTGHAGDTLVAFTSDHGEGLAHHQMVRKWTSYDEAAKVPLLVSWPGSLPMDSHNAVTLTSGLDLVPTFCDYARIAPPPDARGISLRSVLEEKESQPRDFIAVEVPEDVGRVVRTPQYKYVTYAGETVDQLFDMQSDAGETRNLAGSSANSQILQDHRKLLSEWEGGLDPAPGQPHATAWWRRQRT